MWSMTPRAHELGFELQIENGSRATLQRGTWEQRFYSEEELRRFLIAAEAGQHVQWQHFVSAFDSYNPAHAGEQYRKGRRLADEGAIIYISRDAGWSYETPPSRDYQTAWSSTMTYETLGLHSNTAQLVLGWLDGGACIIDYRALYH